MKFFDQFDANLIEKFGQFAYLCGVFIYFALSLYLLRLNFDLHHDGYIFSQSARLFEEERISDTFLQYGVIYHMLVGALLTLSDGNPISVRLFATILIFCTVFLFQRTFCNRSIDGKFAAIVWLLSCYWFTRYFQFFVQLNPSLIGLFLLVVLFALFCAASKRSISGPVTIIFAAFITTAMLHTKINFGVTSVLISTSGLVLLGHSFAMCLAYLFLVIGLFCLSWFGFGYGITDVAEIFGFHFGFIAGETMLQNFFKVFWLDLQHGGVYRPFAVLFFLPLFCFTVYQLSKLNILFRPKLARFLSLYFEDKTKVLLAVFAIFSWLTIFPTASYQHIWFGGFFGLFFVTNFFYSIPIQKKWKIAAAFLFAVIFMQHLLVGLGSKIYNSLDFRHSGQGHYSALLLNQEQQKFFNFVETYGQGHLDEGCVVLNLTPSGIYSSNPEAFCTFGSTRSNFFWASKHNDSFADFVKFIKNWDGFVLSDIPEIDLIGEVSDKFVITGQDFSSRKYLVNLDTKNRPEDFESMLYEKNKEKTSKTGAVSREINELHFTGKCPIIRALLAKEPDLPVSFDDENGCKLTYERPLSYNSFEAKYLIIYLKLVTTNQIFWHVS